MSHTIFQILENHIGEPCSGGWSRWLEALDIEPAHLQQRMLRPDRDAHGVTDEAVLIEVARGPQQWAAR